MLNAAKLIYLFMLRIAVIVILQYVIIIIIMENDVAFAYNSMNGIVEHLFEFSKRFALKRLKFETFRFRLSPKIYIE